MLLCCREKNEVCFCHTLRIWDEHQKGSKKWYGRDNDAASKCGTWGGCLSTPRSSGGISGNVSYLTVKKMSFQCHAASRSKVSDKPDLDAPRVSWIQCLVLEEQNGSRWGKMRVGGVKMYGNKQCLQCPWLALLSCENTYLRFLPAFFVLWISAFLLLPHSWRLRGL